MGTVIAFIIGGVVYIVWESMKKEKEKQQEEQEKKQQEKEQQKWRRDTDCKNQEYLNRIDREAKSLAGRYPKQALQKQYRDHKAELKRLYAERKELFEKLSGDHGKTDPRWKRIDEIQRRADYLQDQLPIVGKASMIASNG